jgi:serine/threonine protein kinase
VFKAEGTYENFFEDDGLTKLKIPYAVKVFDRNELKRKMAATPADLKPRTMLAMMEEETELAGMLKNPYINKAFWLFDNPDVPKMYLVMQFADYGNLGSLSQDGFQIN